MPPIDFSHAPQWVQWVIIGTAILALLVGIIQFVRKGWPVLSRFVSTINALGSLPSFIEESEKFRASQEDFRTTTGVTLSRQDKTLAVIKHEVEYNNGSSVKDAIARVEKGVAGLYVRADATDLNAKQMHDELEQTKPATPRRRKPTPKKETS